LSNKNYCFFINYDDLYNKNKNKNKTKMIFKLEIVHYQIIDLEFGLMYLILD